MRSIRRSPHATIVPIAKSSIRRNEFPFRCDCGLCCLARERAEQTRATRKRCPPCGDASVIVGVMLASALQPTRNGSLEMHAVIGSARSGSRSSFVGLSMTLERASLRHDQALRPGAARRQGRPLDLFLRGIPSVCGVKPLTPSLDVRSVESTDDTGLLTGSASFSGNPAWGRRCELTDVQCMLTRRTRLQYMCCNGVGGSTC